LAFPLQTVVASGHVETPVRVEIGSRIIVRFVSEADIAVGALLGPAVVVDPVIRQQH
jgi:hypothetical protein